MRVQRRAKRQMNQINVVPYIDVMLVLLIIFMITAPMMNPGQIELPEVGEAAELPVAPMEVRLDEDLALTLVDHAQGGQETIIGLTGLAELLRDKQLAQPDQAVVISAHKNVRYEEVINIMDALRKRQIKKIGLLTQTKN